VLLLLHATLYSTFIKQLHIVVVYKVFPTNAITKHEHEYEHEHEHEHDAFQADVGYFYLNLECCMYRNIPITVYVICAWTSNDE
jgi:hypothetical protein